MVVHAVAAGQASGDLVALWTAPSLIETRFSQILLSGEVSVFIYGNSLRPCSTR
jgi:hypothetical protein